MTLAGGLVSGLVAAWIGVARTPPPPEVPEPSAWPREQRLGRIAISSIPRGAMVEVNGEPVRLESGEPARTPISALTELQYGKTYSIRLVLEGHGDFRYVLTMDESNDMRHIYAELQPD